MRQSIATPDALPTTSRRAAMAHARELAREETADVATQAKQMIAGSILLVFGLVIGLLFYPLISGAAEDAATDTNTSSRDATMIRLLPTIVVVVLIVSGLGFLFVGIRGLAS